MRLRQINRLVAGFGGLLSVADNYADSCRHVHLTMAVVAVFDARFGNNNDKTTGVGDWYLHLDPICIHEGLVTPDHQTAQPSQRYCCESCQIS